MTISEILKAKGVADDVIKGILEDMKANKLYTASEENLDIRYNKLKADHEGAAKQLGEANALIEELKKTNQGNEGLQQKVSAYEAQVQQLQRQLEETKLDAAIKVGLLAEKALDVDYLTYKLKNKGEALALGEDGKIKDWENKISALKTQCPAQFEGGKKKIDENKLHNGGEDDENAAPKTLEDALKQAYEPRKE